MTRKLTSFEVKVTLANMARMAPDDLDGYVIILAKDDDVTSIMTNCSNEASAIMLLARAIEQRSMAVAVLEELAARATMDT